MLVGISFFSLFLVCVVSGSQIASTAFRHFPCLLVWWWRYWMHLRRFRLCVSMLYQGLLLCCLFWCVIGSYGGSWLRRCSFFFPFSFLWKSVCDVLSYWLVSIGKFPVLQTEFWYFPFILSSILAHLSFGESSFWSFWHLSVSRAPYFGSNSSRRMNTLSVAL